MTVVGLGVERVTLTPGTDVDWELYISPGTTHKPGHTDRRNSQGTACCMSEELLMQGNEIFL